MNLTQFFTNLAENLIEILNTHTVLAPFILLTAEEFAIPLPLPGDVVIAYTGYQISKGRLAYHEAFIIIVLGVIIGSSILYYLSSKWGQMIVLKLGKFINLDKEKLLYIEKKFRKHGMWFIIIGRQIPGLRIPITIFSGMSDVSYPTFIKSVLASTVIWIPVYFYIGKMFGAKSAKLLSSHYWYLFLIVIPIIVAIIYIAISRFTYKNKTKQGTNGIIGQNDNSKHKSKRAY